MAPPLDDKLQFYSFFFLLLKWDNSIFTLISAQWRFSSGCNHYSQFVMHISSIYQYKMYVHFIPYFPSHLPLI